MLSLVRSRESTRKGAVPPINVYSKTPNDHISVAMEMGSFFRISGASV